VFFTKKMEEVSFFGVVERSWAKKKGKGAAGRKERGGD
jgi:hypothetical protein